MDDEIAPTPRARPRVLRRALPLPDLRSRRWLSPLVGVSRHELLLRQLSLVVSQALALVEGPWKLLRCLLIESALRTPSALLAVMYLEWGTHSGVKLQRKPLQVVMTAMYLE